jgi:hypothetical protein
LETTSEVKVGKKIEKPHVNNFQCYFCDFQAKNLGGLKTQIRRMHNLEQNMHVFEYCTFISKTESDLKTHCKTFNTTHSHLVYNEHYEEENFEIFALKEMGLMLLGMQHYSNDQLTEWMKDSLMTLGKNPR